MTRREVVSRITDKSFLLGTAFMVVLIAGFIGFSAWQEERTDTVTLAATPDAAAMATAVADAAPGVDENVEVTVLEVDDRAAAESALREDEVDAWLHPADDGWQLTSESSEQGSLTSVVEVVVQQQVLADNAAEVGTTVESLQAGSTVTTDFLRGDAEKAGVAEAVGFVFVFLFYFAALVFGMQLASSVIEEKQSRIVEIIAAAIPVRHLLAGKVLGNTALAVIQLMVYSWSGSWGCRSRPTVLRPGAVGSDGVVHRASSSRVHRAGLPVGGRRGARLAHRGPAGDVDAADDADARDVLRRAVPRRPRTGDRVVRPARLGGLMPKRILAGGVEWWEPLLALGLLAAFAAVTVWIGERLYRRALLQTGGRVSLRQAWSAAE